MFLNFSNVHSSAAAHGVAKNGWVLPAYFAVGLIAKFFGRRATHDDRSIVYLILLLLFSFVLGMRLLPAILFFLFIWVMGLVFVAFPSAPLWRKWVVRRTDSLKSNPALTDPKRQLFRDRLDFFRYSMPLITFIPFQFLSLVSGVGINGEIFWAILYYPSLAVNDIVVFVRSRFVTQA